MCLYARLHGENQYENLQRKSVRRTFIRLKVPESLICISKFKLARSCWMGWAYRTHDLCGCAEQPRTPVQPPAQVKITLFMAYGKLNTFCVLQPLSAWLSYLKFSIIPTHIRTEMHAHRCIQTGTNTCACKIIWNQRKHADENMRNM